MTQLPRVAAKTAGELCADMPLSEEARELLDDAKTPAALLDELVQAELYADAAKLLARGLPRQDAVWWGLTCARSVVGSLPAPKVRGALDAAEAWVLSPADDKRRAAMPAAELAGFGTPAGCVAAAAFFSGGSLAPPEVAPVPPPEHLMATTVANAVILSAVKDPEKTAERYREFLAMGVEIANGRGRWPGAAAAGASSRGTDSGGSPHPSATRGTEPGKGAAPPGPPRRPEPRRPGGA